MIQTLKIKSFTQNSKLEIQNFYLPSTVHRLPSNPQIWYSTNTMSDTRDKTKDTDDLRQMVREEVREALRDFYNDPDSGLELRDDFLEELEQSREEADNGQTVPLEEVKKEHGLG